MNARHRHIEYYEDRKNDEHCRRKHQALNVAEGPARYKFPVSTGWFIVDIHGIPELLFGCGYSLDLTTKLPLLPAFGRKDFGSSFICKSPRYSR